MDSENCEHCDFPRRDHYATETYDAGLGPTPMVVWKGCLHAQANPRPDQDAPPKFKTTYRALGPEDYANEIHIIGRRGTFVAIATRDHKPTRKEIRAAFRSRSSHP